MSEYLIQFETLKEIADAIREKKGITNSIPVPSLASEIRSIETSNGESNNKLVLLVSDHSYSYSITAKELEGATSISADAFYQRSGLSSIGIPDGVTRIGAMAFNLCRDLTSVIFGENSQLTDIGERAFDYCYNLTNIMLPNNVKTIGSGAFYGCDSLTRMVIPSGVTTINKETFKACSSLTSVVIPASVTTIGNQAFYNCRSLTSIVIPGGVTTIGDSAFVYCDGLTDVYYTGTEEQWNEISIGFANTELTNATIHYNYVPE